MYTAKERRAAASMYRRKWRARNPEKDKLMRQKSDHKSKHGEPYEAKLDRIEKQGGICANPGCRTKDPGLKGWHTDHNHITGDIRGELCQGCNLALGWLKDNEARAEGLAAYLRYHK